MAANQAAFLCLAGHHPLRVMPLHRPLHIIEP